MKTATFLIKATSGREAVMRLPVGKYGALTRKAFDAISARFYEGASDTRGQLQYALNLEAFSTADTLIEALQKYKKDQI